MSMNFSNPSASLCDGATNEKDKALWEKEDLGGITEDNHSLPVPVLWLLILTVLTAFAITFPLWGQRPTAAIYEGYVKAMNTPEVQALQDDDAAMKKIVQMNVGGPNDALLARHPLNMNDLRIIKPQIEALMASGADLQEYTVVGEQVVMANFEGNTKADGTPERKQPWWDNGYTIDIFYVLYFFTMVSILIKRLPPSTWQPKHKK